MSGPESVDAATTLSLRQWTAPSHLLPAVPATGDTAADRRGPDAAAVHRLTRQDDEHLWRTCHPRTRPDEVPIDPGVRWDGLTILQTTAGGPDDATGEVTFEARFTTVQGPGVFRERSRFERRGGRWLYVDGDQERDDG